MDDIALTVNGRRRLLEGITAHTTALEWLRLSGLTGSKEGCAEGECGACAVMVAAPDERGRTAWTAVNACLVPVGAMSGQEIVTAEGLGSPDQLHPVQEKLAAAGGSQCGYCSPGFACSMAAEYYREDRAPLEHPEVSAAHGPNGFDLHALGGNLCRCTGYRPIRDAAYALGSPEPSDELAARRQSPAPAPLPTDFEAAGGRFVRPATLPDALVLLRENPSARPVAGSTDVGVEMNLHGRRDPLLVAIEQLEELRALTISDSTIEIGAALALSDVERRLDGRVPLLAELLPQFASRLIRNRATLGGNLGTGSPIGDAAPALLALGARVVLVSVDTEREVDLAEYFTGYRQTVRRSDELILGIRIPLPLARVSAFHKISKRRFDDISSVAVGFAVDIEDGIITAARIGLGGVAATPIRAFATEDALIDRPWNVATVRSAAEVLGNEGAPLSDQRASAAYRALMLNRALLKLHSATLLESRDVSA
ncbi:2Fe-2S iron-sulfur cluster binding domain-containing protein [Microbacterium sp. 4R-513]|uniref:xanthine dehydrogenase small subunit n=1 Tax=Microbacterium sp. 4R-513 TaxID=2567934 RepID=UPI0013E0EF98|nr:FAD binding domain-containing protein [Microbacterium sp. 4R-513]QIG38753.1 2Fe-2S iron-sulfur cluster binding domain-containing protein [Microbacterium sp. 4R-513]